MPDISKIRFGETELNFKDAIAREMISQFGSLSCVVCDSLENTPDISSFMTGNGNIQGTLLPSADTKNKIYLVPNGQSDQVNTYDEILTVEIDTSIYKWERIGSTQIDLSQYYTKSQVDELLSSTDSTTDSYTKEQSDSLYVSLVNSTVFTTFSRGRFDPEDENEDTVGDGSFAFGEAVTASGELSHAEGSGTVASGEQSHTEGGGTTASGLDSHAEGLVTVASGDFSHAEGLNTTASGDQSHTEGFDTQASGVGSHAEGNSTIASGLHAHAEGTGTEASGDNSHTEGGGATASGKYSHAEGSGTESQGEASHAEGGGTVSSGMNAHAEGLIANATGDFSHAEGMGTIATGANSHAEGAFTSATRKSQHVFGEFNVADDGGDVPTDYGDYIEIVGNGNNSRRSNARTLDWEGNEWLAGSLILGNTALTENNLRTLLNLASLQNANGVGF